MATIWGSTGTTNTTQRSVEPVKADVYRYVNEVSDDGWINVQEGASTRLPLCKYTKVMLLGTKKGRTNFKILDGTHAGRTVSMKEENATKYLGTTAPKDSDVEVVVTYGKYEENWTSTARINAGADKEEKLNQQWATLSADGVSVKVTMNTVWGSPNNFFPLPPGEYRILIPDVPHQGELTTFYRKSEPSLKHDQVWFPIKYGNNSRYIHIGNVSDGCTTVVDLAKWVELHEKIISHRSEDGKSVGKLIVKGKPEREK